jgi:predicted  nucleic acid-binding Zn-ribbon protein
MDVALLAERVELIEESVRALVTLPERMEAMEQRFADVEGRLVNVEGQIVRLRDEMHSESSAIRSDLRGLTVRFEALYERGEDTRRYMRVLHEEVLERIGRLGEGRSGL